MKKVILLLCLTLVSCFTEPKKIETEKEKVIEPLIKKDSIEEKEVETNLIENDIDENQNTINGDISLNVMEKLLNSDNDNFTEWCFENGYTFDEIKNYEYFDVYWYKIENKKYISFSVSKHPLSKKSILFETNDEIEFEKLYIECIRNNYKFIENKESTEKRLHKIFTNNKYEIAFIKSDNIEKMKFSVGLKLL